MLREAVVKLVVSWLESLVVDFNEDQLKVSLWNGDVVVSDLVIFLMS